ncbi:MAG: DNA polymerase IV [Acetobacteraceae bacterium]
MAVAALITAEVPTLCRDCFALTNEPAGQACCRACGSPRVIGHTELCSLSIAHIDCDAFYASVEKRDRPELADRPVIVGGGRRGVVATACYVARLSGVRSAMPMYRAYALCPDAVVIAPDFAKYASAARAIRARMRALTPLVQPLSIDEAALDLGDSRSRHGAPAGAVLARFAREIEDALGLTVSVGLASNRLLAKIAVERDKPRGFAAIGRVEARTVLGLLPVRELPGVGPVQERRLAARGITRLSDLQGLTEAEQRSLGPGGPALALRAIGEDARPVRTTRDVLSVSVERTLESDVADLDALARFLLPLAERLAHRLVENRLKARGIALKLRTGGFSDRTRHARLPFATADADSMFAGARRLLESATNGRTRFRLIGLSAEPLVPAASAENDDLVERAVKAQ